MSSGSLATILLLDEEGKRLRHAAAPSLPASYTEAMGDILVGASVGSCGTAAHRREPVFVADIATDPLWTNYRDLSLAHGLRASWSTPIFSSEGYVLGTFAILSRAPGGPAALHHHIIEQITHLAAVAIERERTESALRQSEERFRRMAVELRRSEAYLAEAQKLSQTGSFCLRVASRELISSAETVRIGGWEAGTQPSLEQALERVHPDDRLRVQAMLEKALQDGSLLDYEHRMLLPDGTVRHVHTVARSMRDASGEVEFVGAVMDITEKKQADDALHAAKARFKGILEIAEDAIISVDANQRIVLFNQGAEKVFGYAQTEVVGTSLDLLLPQRFASAHREHLKEFAQSPDVARMMGQRREVFGRRKDGSEFPAEASISKLDLGGELVFSVILRDITDRKQVAEALHASQQLARGQVEALTRTLDALAMESVPDRLAEHVLRTMTDQLHAHSSSVWRRDEARERMVFEFAFESGRLVTKSDTVIGAVNPSLPIKDIWPWSEVFRTGKPSVLEDIRKGPIFPWRDHLLAQGVITILVVPMLVAGQAAGVIGIRFTRQRAFRAAEIELAQALANQAMLAIQLTRLSAQSRQSAVVAERNRMARDIHDTLAQGFTSVILQLEAVGEATSQRLAGKAGEHLTRASELAREGLREARRSVWALRPQTLEEKDLCEALKELIQKMTEGTSVQAQFTVQGESRELPPEWEENLLRIGQEVLTNVLRHAQATQFNAQLAFDKGEVRLNLRDNGSGFDPVRRHDGFGLQGMRERAEGMGGQLSIQSAEGEGTTISITLPLANAFHLAA
jgi:PAS domain S-box-containing protein